MGKQNSAGGWIAAVVIVAAVVAAGVYLARRATQPQTPPMAEAPAASVASPAATAPPVQHPIEQAQTTPASSATVAPAPLDGSDDAIAAAFSTLAGGKDLSALLVQPELIQRIVATVDLLPRHGGLGSLTLPVHPPKGSFMLDESAASPVVAAGNSARYTPYMQIVAAVEPQALVDWYVHAYPLFQEAYRQLGYPDGYFNDRLIVAIDDMLAAPEPVAPPLLERSQTYVFYANPALESLSAGQKLMLRVGHDNELKIKAKLRAIRSKLKSQE